MCPLYTHVTPILQCIGPCDLFRSFRWIFVFNVLLHGEKLYLLRFNHA